MSAALLHFHRPRVSVSSGVCRICGALLGPDPVLVRTEAGEEWVSRDCFLRIEHLLTELGRRQIRRWINGGIGRPLL